MSQPSPPALVYVFPEVLTHREAIAERERLLRAVGQGAARIDMSALAVFDSSVLALMLAALRAPDVSTRPVTFEAVPDKLRSLAQLYGLQEVFSDALS